MSDVFVRRGEYHVKIKADIGGQPLAKECRGLVGATRR